MVGIERTEIIVLQNKMKDLQLNILNIFVEIDKVCKKNNLRYYAIGGTCLGAVRHQGFIPWDDDLDIAMPRPDYEKFLSIAEKELPSNLKIFHVNQGKNYICRFSKVHDTTTTFVEKGMKIYQDRYTGVYVDIMPLDGIPENEEERKKYFYRLLWLSRFDWHRKYEQNKILNADKGIRRKVFWKCIYPFLALFPANYFSEKYLKLQKRYPYETSTNLSYTWSWRASKVIFPKKDFENYVLLPFENVQMRCPVGYDNFLTILFGDYMKLPPKEQQVACHEADILDLERPFSYYMKEREKE